MQQLDMSFPEEEIKFNQDKNLGNNPSNHWQNLLGTSLPALPLRVSVLICEDVGEQNTRRC